MLSNASKYAITAVLHLSKNASVASKLSAKQIAKKLNLPAPFLAKTLQELTKKKMSLKGLHGGFYLPSTNKKNTLNDVIDCIDDIEKFNQCYLGQNECKTNNRCVVHHIYFPFKNKLLEKLKNKTILEWRMSLLKIITD